MAVDLLFRTRLVTPADEVWAHACTMEGANRELAPLVTMTVPKEARGRPLSDATPGVFLFHSVLLAGGFVPFDLHALRLVEMGPGRRFLERSRSLVHRVWEHERAVRDDGHGCLIEDRLHVEPRARFVEPLVHAVVRRVFEHRHRVLARLFGG